MERRPEDTRFEVKPRKIVVLALVSGSRQSLCSASQSRGYDKAVWDTDSYHIIYDANGFPNCSGLKPDVRHVCY